MSEESWVQIICAIIGMGGTILAAIIGLNLFDRTISRHTNSYFTTYSNEKHNAKRHMNRARESIIIVAAYGDRFLKKHTNDLVSYLKKGIKIEYLMLDYTHAVELESTYFGESIENTNESLREVLKTLQELNIHRNFEVRVLDTFMSTSYIGVDIYENGNLQWFPSANIQMMPYQFGVSTPNSPLTFLNPKENKLHFKTVADSIQNMWAQGNNIDFRGYNREIENEITCWCGSKKSSNTSVKQESLL